VGHATATPQNGPIDDNDMDISGSHDDEEHISSPLIMRDEAIASGMHTVHSDEPSSDTAVTTPHKRNATH